MSQLVRSTNSDRYTYLEFGSKNHPGGVNDTSGKSVTIVDVGGQRSHVVLLDQYLSKVPKDNIDNDSLFYLSPLPFTPLRQRPWYFSDPYPIRALDSLLKTMTSHAGLKGNYTNHSLRATGATVLFDVGIPEAVIQKRTGHKSLEALRTYERTTTEQNTQVSGLLHEAATSLEQYAFTPEEIEQLECTDDF